MMKRSGPSYLALLPCQHQGPSWVHVQHSPSGSVRSGFMHKIGSEGTIRCTAKCLDELAGLVCWLCTAVSSTLSLQWKEILLESREKKIPSFDFWVFVHKVALHTSASKCGVSAACQKSEFDLSGFSTFRLVASPQILTQPPSPSLFPKSAYKANPKPLQSWWKTHKNNRLLMRICNQLLHDHVPHRVLFHQFGWVAEKEAQSMSSISAGASRE